MAAGSVFVINHKSLINVLSFKNITITILPKMVSAKLNENVPQKFTTFVNSQQVNYFYFLLHHLIAIKCKI